MTTNIPDCMTELKQTTSQDEHLHHCQEHIIRGWPNHGDQIPQDRRPHLMFHDDMVGIDGVVLKNRHVIKPEALQRQALEQPHVYHM